MPSLVDLVGRTFGNLTVSRYTGKRMWCCNCVCGNVVEIRGDHLKKGETLSCGCLTQNNLVGRCFGEWVVIRRAGHLYECRCSCGTVALLQSSNLLSGSTRSCGCLPRFRDLQGKSFGRLNVLFKLKGKPTLWVCECLCGNHARVFGTNLTQGRTRSCGCLGKELVAARLRTSATTHGMSRARVYRCYQGMMSRCYNPNSSNFDRYGGRGIEVNERWRGSFETFFHDMGHPPSPEYTLDRYPDPDGPYSRDNCRWATPKEQARNRSTCVRLTYGGVTRPRAEWAEITGVSSATIGRRLSCGWGVERALTTPSLRGRSVLGGSEDVPLRHY